MIKKVILFLTLLSLCFSIKAENKTETSYRNAFVFAYSPVNSVFEDDNLRLEIYDGNLYATNKTQQAIFIDLSQCFLSNNGSAYPIGDWNNEKKSSKANVVSEDRYLSIAPSSVNSKPTGICSMMTQLNRESTWNTFSSQFADFSEYDKRLLNLVGEMVTESLQQDPKQKKYIGTVHRHLSEDESINNIGASIAYAFNKNADDWMTIAISTWVSDVIFTPYYLIQSKGLSEKEVQGFGVKEAAANIVHFRADSPFEYDEDKSPIIGCDWTGDYKKGTFKLSPLVIMDKPKVKGLGFAKVMTLGRISRMIPEYETKTRCNFDGDNDDWGKLTYVSKIKDTKQKRKAIADKKGWYSKQSK